MPNLRPLISTIEIYGAHTEKLHFIKAWVGRNWLNAGNSSHNKAELRFRDMTSGLWDIIPRKEKEGERIPGNCKLEEHTFSALSL